MPRKVAFSPLEVIFDALNRASVRYVVVGGVAVVLHGFARLTGDLDLMIDLAPDAARRALRVMTRLGLRPRVPVKVSDFADADTRRRWRLEKHMQVFTMIDPDDPTRQVDLFVEPPLPFEDVWRRAELVATANTTARIAAIEDLIHLKRLAGRRRDIEDIEALEEIRRRRASR